MSDIQPLIELHEVAKHYQFNGIPRQVLTGISLRVHPGDSIAITGPSGSGKTTLLNLLGLLDVPGSGEIRFMGLDVQQMTADELSDARNAHIGFIFQLHYLLPQLSLIENVMVPLIPLKDQAKKRKALDRALELLNSVGLSDKAEQRPGQLSVGECQRAAVVRALVNEPELVLADEPTGSLDQETGDHLGELLTGLCGSLKVGLVVVTHSPDLAQRMEQRYRILNGKLISMQP
ncbi:MAG: ABC transporter ATP-binding protein [Bacteroidales bacterium]